MVDKAEKINFFDDVRISQQSFSYGDLTGTDKWNIWTPVRSGWTDVGSPTVSGQFHIVGRQVFIQVKIVPGTTVATTAGTSYISLPIPAAGIGGDGSMVNVTTLVAVGACAIDVTMSRIYVPTQAATGNTLTVSGWYQR
jgi:hypothetical protein